MTDSTDFVFDVNLHTHVKLCKHAHGTVAKYCEAARNAGIKILGFSDHSPFPDGEYQDTRMYYYQRHIYREDIEKARKKFPDLTILAGLEIDYLSKYGVDFYKKEFLEEMDLDYLIGGVHFITDAVTGKDMKPHPHYPSDDNLHIIRRYKELVIELMQTGLLTYLNHPDMIGWAYIKFTPCIESLYREIIEKAIELDIPLEINANGVRKGKSDYGNIRRCAYPEENFWKMVSTYKDARVVIGSDAHAPKDIIDSCDVCIEIAKRYGLTPCNREVAEQIIANRKTRS